MGAFGWGPIKHGLNSIERCGGIRGDVNSVELLCYVMGEGRHEQLQAEEQPFAKRSLHVDGFLSIICASGDGFRFSFVVRNRKGSWI